MKKLENKVAIITGTAAGLGKTLLSPSSNPMEVAQIELFLVSDDAGFVNGAVLVADEGWTAY